MNTILIIAYVILAILNVIMARAKNLTQGIGYFVIFIFSLLLTPIPFFIFLLIINPRTDDTQRKVQG